MDDAPDLRVLLADMLAEQGFSILEAVDAAGGLEIIRSDKEIDLLITDIGLPGGMNGAQFAQSVRLERPSLPVLFVTGLTAGEMDKDEDRMAILHKPFSFGTFQEQVNSLLNRTGTC